jgi:chloramphenicol O-acetyltransferase type A
MSDLPPSPFLIDLSTYPRRAHFDLFRTFDYPHFNLTATVEISRFQPAIKARGAPFTLALIFVLARSANRLPEFRQRIRISTQGEAQIVEHAAVHPAPTLPVGDDLFGFYSAEFVDDFVRFAAGAQAAIDRAIANPALHDEPGRDDWLYMSAIPWVSFTGLAHPIHMHPADSIPRMSWGKFTRSGRRIKLPLSVQVNHALVDGLHVGRYFELVQAGLDETDWLG